MSLFVDISTAQKVLLQLRQSAKKTVRNCQLRKCRMKGFVGEFCKFVGINKKLSWIKDIFFWSALFFAIPIRVLILPEFSSGSAFCTRFLFVNLILIAFSEELFFRGFLIPAVAYKLKGKIFIFSYANIVTAFIFSISHLFAHGLFWSASVFIPALFYGYFRERHDSILPAVVLHFFYNFVYFCM